MAKVKNTFGEPHWIVQDQTNIYLIYQYSRPLTLANACVLLDFGDQKALHRYEIKSCGLFGEDCPTHPAGEIEWGGLDCRQLFWTLDQLKQMGIEDPEDYTSSADPSFVRLQPRYHEIADLPPHEQILVKAEQGDAEAQLQLYWSSKEPRRLTWLRRSADHGLAEASYRIGRLYQHGQEGLPRDNARAYLWYRLASIGGHSQAKIELQDMLPEMSAEQMDEAGRLFHEWKPGQCESVIIGDIPSK